MATPCSGSACLLPRLACHCLSASCYWQQELLQHSAILISPSLHSWPLLRPYAVIASATSSDDVWDIKYSSGWRDASSQESVSNALKNTSSGVARGLFFLVVFSFRPSVES